MKSVDKYINSRCEQVKNHNIRTSKEVENLKSILESGISNYKCISIEEFIKSDMQELTLPDELLAEIPQPIKPSIKRPSLINRFIKPKKEKYNEYIEELELKYRSKYKLNQEKENKILKEIEDRKKEYGLYANADPQFISSYKKHILDNSDYPFDHNKKVYVQYINDSRELVINYLLPKMDIIPPIKEYHYIKMKDEIGIKERSLNEIRDMYKDVIFSITIRTIYEGFNSYVKEHIDSIVFNGYVQDLNTSTNKDMNPCIISLRTFKDDFNKIDLSNIDKYKCLQDMNVNLYIDSNLNFKEIDPFLFSICYIFCRSIIRMQQQNY